MDSNALNWDSETVLDDLAGSLWLGTVAAEGVTSLSCNQHQSRLRPYYLLNVAIRPCNDHLINRGYITKSEEECAGRLRQITPACVNFRLQAQSIISKDLDLRTYTGQVARAAS